MLDEEKKNDHLLRHALNRWAESSPLQASDWYIKQFSEQQQPKAISQAATSFAARDPQAALDWVDSLNRSDTDFAIEELLHRASYENPEFVIAHLDRVNEEQRKVSVLQSAIYSIHQQDPVKAKGIIDASPYKEKLEEYLNRINDY
jgi:basic membrane lipoprotein Med (substrate-binding protein (PBP1-ABC) superfamily)